jgi:hypothetical protein
VKVLGQERGHLPNRFLKSVVLWVKVCEIGGVNLTVNQPLQKPEGGRLGGSLPWCWCILFFVSLCLPGLSLCALGAAPQRVEGVSPEGNRLWERARRHAEQGDDFSAADAAEELLREAGLPAPLLQEAWRLVARGAAQYATPAGWAKVLAASEAQLGMPGLPADWRLEALRQGATAAAELRAHNRAELFQRALIAEPQVSAVERVTMQLALARSLWGQCAFAGCRELLAQMEVELAAAWRSGESERRRQVEHLRAERQMLLAECLMQEGDQVFARLLLAEIPKMPGQTTVSGPAREAVCLLQRQEKPGGPRRIQRVLFVGSSHTIRGNIPALVEQIAASAPPGQVRIVAGERTRMGTGMRGHWNDGLAHDAARGWIAAGGWDTVVVETFYRTNREDLLAFGSGYREEVRSSGARLLIYETPVAKAIEYPAAYEAHHRTNVWLGLQLGSSVAPCVKAWMGVLGERPEQRALEQLYADWIHASARGAYLSACCLYAALSGESPVGLWTPPGLLSADEALAYQRSAWKAFLETRSELERARSEKLGN